STRTETSWPSAGVVIEVALVVLVHERHRLARASSPRMTRSNGDAEGLPERSLISIRPSGLPDHRRRFGKRRQDRRRPWRYRAARSPCGVDGQETWEAGHRAENGDEGRSALKY